LKYGDWIKVTGRVSFRESRDTFETILNVANPTDIQAHAPDPDPYVQ
jgi:hypothetical protein